MAGGTPAAEAVEKLRRAVLGIMATRGFALQGAIPPDMTFRAWCEDLGRRGLKIDRKPFRLDDRPALLPIYDAIPTTRAAAAGRTLVIQKATQLGLTVWEVLADDLECGMSVFRRAQPMITPTRGLSINKALPTQEALNVGDARHPLCASEHGS